MKKKSELIDIILSNKNLHDMEVAGGIISEVKSQEQMEIAKEILSRPELYNNPQLWRYSWRIISSIDERRKESSTECIQFINKFLSNERLCKNTYFLDKASDIIVHINIHPERTKLVLDIIDKLSAEEKYLDKSAIVTNLTDLILSILSTKNV